MRILAAGLDFCRILGHVINPAIIIRMSNLAGGGVCKWKGTMKYCLFLFHVAANPSTASKVFI